MKTEAKDYWKYFRPSACNLTLKGTTQEEVFQDFGQSYLEMDQFAQEERAWNPFLIDFYLPPDVREGFYSFR